MIEVRYKARLGNNLFQYCLGRIIAEELGFALHAEAIPGFPNTSQKVEGAEYEGPAQTLTGQRIHLDEIIADRSPRRIVLDGWFQRHEYYRPRRARIQKWLAFDPAIPVPVMPPDLVLHVRRTDYVNLGWAMPFSFYEEVLGRFLPQRGTLWIVTDDRKDPFFKCFARWHPRFFTGTALESMVFMTMARRLVMSHSTFSWWPTFLGDPEEVVCALPSFGAWSEQGEARDAGLIERDRFTCIECRQSESLTKAELRHQNWRSLKRRAVLWLNRRLRLTLPVPPP